MGDLILTSQFSRVADKLSKYIVEPIGELKVLLVITASNPYKQKPWLEEDHSTLTEMGFEVDIFDIENKTEMEVRNELDSHDIFFVAGGNVAYLLQKSLESGFLFLVKEFVNKGKIYIGSSAGSIFAGPSIEPFVKTDLSELSSDFRLTTTAAAGLVDFIILPHYQDTAYNKEYTSYIIPDFSRNYILRSLDDDHAYLVINGEEKLV